LLALLSLLGPRTGVPVLQALCPALARREVQDLLRRFRRVWRRRHRRLLRGLHWQRPGSVWAIDFAEPPVPIDGCFTAVLAVRDLASSLQLLWLPVTAETAQVAIDALTLLFRAHGPPLVLKSDNGSAFIASDTHQFLERWQVWQLRSPPELPQYNGSCEAGIGSMKTRTHHQACQSGHAGAWTCDDLEAALLQANLTARPWGCQGPIPDEAWQQRQPIRPKVRRAFAETVRQQTGTCPPTDTARWREAIVAALEEHGLLRFSRETVAVPLRVAGRKPAAEERRRPLP
jgi:hypothetical protein